MPIIPEKLKKGDKVVIVAPAGGPRAGQLDLLRNSLEKLGLEVQIDPHCYIDNGYFAGSGKQRAEALNRCFADKSISGIFCVRGGCGSADTINYLDFDLIKKNPKVFVGMSDITFLLNALYKKTGNIFYAGPVSLHFDRDEEFALDDLNKKLFNNFDSLDISNTEVLIEGEAEGILVGGNSMIMSTMLGTEYLPEDKKIILLLEEVRAYGYALDRILCHLRNAGVFDRVEAVVIGDNDYYEEDSYHLSYKQMIMQYVKPNTPICYGAKFGHKNYHMIIPIGQKVRLCLKNDKKELILT